MKVPSTHKRVAGLFMLLSAILLISPPAWAMKLVNQNLTQLISTSESIVMGTVKSVTDGIDDKGVPYTEVTLAVGSTAKGKIKANSDYTFRQFGLLAPRTMANGRTYLAVTPEGFPRWAEGETVTAFLYKPARQSGLQTTAGMTHGKFNLVNGTLVNANANVGLFDGVKIEQALLNAQQAEMLNTTGAVDAAAFMELVGRAISEGWIENGEMK